MMEPTAALVASSGLVGDLTAAMDELIEECKPDAAVRPGSNVEFERAYLDHYADALRWARALMADRDRAADVVHESFVRIFSKARPIRDPDAFAFYLRRTMLRVATSRWRSEQRDDRRSATVAALGPSPIELPADVDPELLAAVRRLPTRQRAVVVLRYWLDWSERDIAAVLGCRPGTVKSLASRALSMLRMELSDG